MTNDEISWKHSKEREWQRRRLVSEMRATLSHTSPWWLGADTCHYNNCLHFISCINHIGKVSLMLMILASEEFLHMITVSGSAQWDPVKSNSNPSPWINCCSVWVPEVNGAAETWSFFYILGFICFLLHHHTHSSLHLANCTCQQITEVKKNACSSGDGNLWNPPKHAFVRLPQSLFSGLKPLAEGCVFHSFFVTRFQGITLSAVEQMFLETNTSLSDGNRFHEGHQLHCSKLI